MVNRIQGDTDEEWEGVIRSQAASAQGELIEADVNASGIDVDTNKSTKWVKAEDIIRVQGFIKASLARWHWNDAVEMAANLYQSNMENVGNAALYLETIARTAEAVVNTRGLEIKKHIVDAELLLRSKSDFEEISAGLENTKSEEAKRWSLRGKLGFDVNEPAIRALATITPQPGDIAAMVSALHRMGEDDQAVQVAKPFEGHPQVLNALGRCLETNDATRAQAVLERSLKIADGQPEIWAEKSMLDERLGEKEFAIQSMENALSYWPDETEWHIRAAHL
jgi:tetratricopeptide (TPR) repeat protein